jgi:hypothetical protein
MYSEQSMQKLSLEFAPTLCYYLSTPLFTQPVVEQMKPNVQQMAHQSLMWIAADASPGMDQDS